MRHAVFCYDSYTMESVLHSCAYFDEEAGFEWRPRPFLEVPSAFPNVRSRHASPPPSQCSPLTVLLHRQLTPDDTALGNEWHVESSFPATKTIAMMDAISAFDPIDFLIQNNKYYGKVAHGGAAYDQLVQLFQMMYCGKGHTKKEDLSADDWMELVISKLHTNGVSPPEPMWPISSEDASQSSGSHESDETVDVGCKRSFSVALL